MNRPHFLRMFVSSLTDQQPNKLHIGFVRTLLLLIGFVSMYSTMSTSCTAPTSSRCADDVCAVTLNRSCTDTNECCCKQACVQGTCQPTAGESVISEHPPEVPTTDSGPTDTPPTDTKPPVDTPPVDTQPVDTPPVDTPPTDGPSVCTDGETRPCYDGDAQTKDKGECKAGNQTCTAGTWGACQGQTLPVSETCDGKDNDCDGEIDEDTPTKGQSCTVGTGECQNTGTLVCKADGSGVECDAKPGQPATETCDAKDNNCDGQVDEGCKCQNGQTQACYSGKAGCTKTGNTFTCTKPCQAGTQTCQGNQWGACTGETLPTQETCDGKDNDCDGQIDNGFTTLGQSCKAGQGSCETTGKLVCKADGSGVECDAKPTTGTKEVCDGKDNDCDGQVDEDFVTKGQSCTLGAAPCQSTGKLVCKSDGSGVECDAKPATGTKEVCDDKDNDCDGQVDEDFSTKGNTCTASQGNCTSTGKLVCKADGSGVECNAAGTGGNKEVCDGKDNDCDGQTDEDFPTKGNTCTVGTGACQATGKLVCKSDGSGVECDAKASGTKELCDGKDNDCDGQVDEDFPTKGSACTVGVGECKNTGTFVCSADQSSVQCNVSAKAASIEVCDGKDNDCDGQVDNNVVRRCTTEASKVNIGICRGGLQTCTNGTWGSCQGEVKSGTELCTGVSITSSDENCDRIHGEGCKCTRGTTRKCGTDVGECSAGSQTCQTNKRWGSCTGGTGPVAEVCDGKDNDCDGQTDEEWPAKGKSCSVGQGECRTTGTLVCNSNGTALRCDATAGSPQTETCDGKDNDCDGQVDEGCP